MTLDGRFHFASEPPVLSPEAWGSLLGHFIVRLAELYAADPRTTDAATTEAAAQKIIVELLQTTALGRATMLGSHRWLFQEMGRPEPRTHGARMNHFGDHLPKRDRIRCWI